jgi:hypothetical protein
MIANGLKTKEHHKGAAKIFAKTRNLSAALQRSGATTKTLTTDHSDLTDQH